jgi:hypothetical protein
MFAEQSTASRSTREWLSIYVVSEARSVSPDRLRRADGVDQR